MLKRMFAVAALFGLFALAPALRADDDEKKAETQETKRGYLGVKIGSEDGSDEVTIAEVTEGGPAAKAGLKEGDVIVKVGKDDVKDVQKFVEKIGSAKPGEKVKLTIKRDGKEQELTVTLGERPKDFPK